MSDKATATQAQSNESEPPPEQWDEQTRRRKQLEILNHFGTIDFDLDPIEIRRLDRERARVRIKS